MGNCNVSQQLQLAFHTSLLPTRSRAWPAGAAALCSSGSAPQPAVFHWAFGSKQPSCFQEVDMILYYEMIKMKKNPMIYMGA